MAAPKGLIFLDSKSAILHEQLQGRVLEGIREPCEINFAEFDDVSFKISCSDEARNIVKVNIAIRDSANLKRMGSQALLDRLFPGMEVAPDQGFNIALQFDCDNLANPQQFLEEISNVKRHIFGGPLDSTFTALAEKRSDNLPVMTFSYRKTDTMFVCPSSSKVVVIFYVDFVDTFDKALARVFLQEFVEAQRTVRTAPPVSYSKEPPGELASVNFPFTSESCGFISFALEERHVAGARKEAAISLLTGFRNYLHYHIKCSKTYLHMRMRKRVAGWMQILNRAMPEQETEKKTAAGKSFTRK